MKRLVNIIPIRVNVFKVAFSSGQKLVHWLNKRDRFEERFNDKKLFLLIYVSLLLVKLSSRREFAKYKKFLFAVVPNGKTSSQHEMQYEGSLDP